MALDLLKEITPVHFQAIFTTAYEKYAVQDIKFSALWLSTKADDITKLIIIDFYLLCFPIFY